MGHDVIDFQVEVIEASMITPILVDFWAPWCGPCRTLGPILERLDAEAKGSWKLAKVNTDDLPEVSTQYSIRGIPAVKLFVDGMVTDEFTGALPEHAVRQWLEQAIPSEAKALFAKAENLLLAGSQEEATSLLETVVEAEPANAAASALLAGALVFTNPQRALTLAATGMSGELRHVQLSESVRTLAAALDPSAAPLPEEPGREHAENAVENLRQMAFHEAAGDLLEVLQKNPAFADGWARKVGVALYTLLGLDHPVTRAHRRTFDMWLS